MKKTILILMVGILLTACSSMTTNKEKDVYHFNYVGTLESLEMSTWQYGTHTLTTEAGDFYAVKSDVLDLNEYTGKSINILGDEIEGYPVDGGPEFINIKKVQSMER